MSFRTWTEGLREVRGDQPNWPWLLGMALDDEFRRQRESADGYAKEVFIDRDEHPHQEGATERRMVAQLYHVCSRENQGCLVIGDEPFWLLGYEWPNQGGDAEKGRRADLVGLGRDGGIVVFECKRANNNDPPLTALIEGLDYLSCLLCRSNFEKIIAGFDRWKAKPQKVVPRGFSGTTPREDARASMIVLAPETYFVDLFSRSKRGEGWKDIARVGGEFATSFKVGLAASDFTSPQASWF